MSIPRPPRQTTATLSALLAAGMCLSLTACSGGDGDETPAADTSSALVEPAAGTDANGVPLTDATGAPVTAADVQADESGLIGTECKGLADLADPERPALDLLRASKRLSPFADWLTGRTVKGVDKTARITALAAKDDLTLVVPAAEAIEAVPAEAIENFADNTELFSDILGYHLVTGRVLPAGLADGPMGTVNGAELVSVQSENGPGLDTATILCGGIEAKGSVIYVVDSVMLPPAR